MKHFLIILSVTFLVQISTSIANSYPEQYLNTYDSIGINEKWQSVGMSYNNQGYPIFTHHFDTLTVENGKLNLISTKKNLLHFFVIDIDTIDITINPALYYRITTIPDDSINVYCGLTYKRLQTSDWNMNLNGSNFIISEENIPQVKRNDTAITQTYTSTLGSQKVVGLFFQIYSYAKVPKNFTVSFDSIWVGRPNSIINIPKVTGYSNSMYTVDDITTLSTGGSPSVSLSEFDNSLKVSIDRSGTGEWWSGFQLTPPVILDLSKNPYLSLKAKADVNANLTIRIVAINGLVEGNQTANIKIVKSTEFNNYYYDLSKAFISSASAYTRYLKGDSSNVVALDFQPEPNNPGFKGAIYLKDMKVGDVADRYLNNPPTIDKINSAINAYIEDGDFEIPLTGITDGDNGNGKIISVVTTCPANNAVTILGTNYVSGADNASIQLTPRGLGTVTITVTVTEESVGFSNTAGSPITKITFKVNVLSNAAIASGGSSKFIVYPAVAATKLNIALSGNCINANYTIFDIAGKLVQSGIINEANNAVNIETLPSGMYFIKVASINASQTQRFIKK